MHVHHDIIDSTNRVAKALLLDPANGAKDSILVTATMQSAGVGQRGRTWACPKGGLWMTLAVPLQNAVSLELLGGRIGDACLAAVSAILEQVDPPISSELKQPNDVLIGRHRRKVLGVLTETYVAPNGVRWASVGVGLDVNVDVAELPWPVQSTATSLLHETGETFDIDACCAIVCSHLNAVLKSKPAQSATCQNNSGI